jgi:outer membrane immunogenic protein
MKTTCSRHKLTHACLVAGLFFLNMNAASAGDTLTSQWSGFYTGGELGAASADFDWQYKNANFFNTGGPVLRGTDFNHDDSSVIGGIFAGYNYQTNPWVVGVEISAAATDLNESGPSPFFPLIDTYTTQLDWLAKVTGRAGYTWDRWLVYAKGGWAGADVELTLNFPAGPVRANTNEFASGWTAGIGVDYMLYDNVTLGLVYDYVDLSIDNETVTCPACGVGVGLGTPVVDGDINIHSIMIRLGFLFPH